MSEFSKVGTVDYYGEYDGLNGYTLVEGEPIEIKFPNGKVMKTKVRVEKGNGSAQIDMNNHPDYFPTLSAYVLYKIEGCPTKFYLRKSDILTRRLEEPYDKTIHRFWNGKWIET